MNIKKEVTRRKKKVENKRLEKISNDNKRQKNFLKDKVNSSLISKITHKRFRDYCDENAFVYWRKLDKIINKFLDEEGE